jgi:peptide deformylase
MTIHVDRVPQRQFRENSRGGLPHPLTLRIYPDSVLRGMCEPIEHFDDWLSDLFEEMLALMRAHNGIGLAAPQVGITRRVFVAEIEGRRICMANPVIIDCSGRDGMVEGCLSLPGVSVKLERDLEIEVRGYSARGRESRHRVQGLWARVLQHEIDHLNGVLISDRAAREPE